MRGRLRLSDVAVSLCETRRWRSMERTDCASHREAATVTGDRRRKFPRPRERRSLFRVYRPSRGILAWFLRRSALLLRRDSFLFQAEYGIRVFHVTGVQTCALPIAFGEALLEALDRRRRPTVEEGEPVVE